MTDWAKQVKHRLIDIEKSQKWLCSEIEKSTGLSVDSGYLRRIFLGERNPPRVIAAVNEILGIKEEAADE